VLHEDGANSRAAKLDNCDVSGSADIRVNDISETSRNSPAAGTSSLAGNFVRGGQSKRFAREGRGRANWQQRNGYRKPEPQTTGTHLHLTSSVQQMPDASGKTQQNSTGDSSPPSSEIPGSSSTQHDPPLPQRNNQRRSYAKDPPPPSSTVNSKPTVESADT